MTKVDASVPPLVAGLALATALILSGCGSAIDGAGSTPSAAVAKAPVATAPVAPAAAAAATPSPSVQDVREPIPTAVPIKLAASIKVPRPIGIASGGGDIWVTTPTGAARIDPATDTVTGKVALGSGDDEIEGIGVDRAGVWVADFDTDAVYRIDPQTLKVVATIAVGAAAERLVATDTAVWVGDHHGGAISRIDPATGTVVATVEGGLPGPDGPQAISLGFGSVWVGIPNTSSVIRIDPVTNAVQATIVEPAATMPCGGLANTADAVWVSSCGETTVIARIDPRSNTVVATIDLGGHAGDAFVVDGDVWFPVEDHMGPTGPVPGTLVRIDPATDRVDRALGIAAHFGAGSAVVVGDSLWVVDLSGDGRILRIPSSALR